jgi:multidrug efflux pump subunit AcrA (membrane-fusion protein)
MRPPTSTKVSPLSSDLPHDDYLMGPYVKIQQISEQVGRHLQVATVVTAILLTGCGRGKAGDEESTTTPRVPVQVTPLREGDIAATVTAPGLTIPLRKERLVAPTSGRIISLNVLEGARVHRGDALVVLRPKESQTAVNGAQQMLRLARNDQERESAKRALALADSIQPRVFVRATCDGVVAARNAAEGENVAEQADLLTVVDLSSVVFLAEIPVVNAGDVHLNQPASVSFPQLDAGRFPAVVDGILPQADAETQAIAVRLRFTGLSGVQREKLKANLQGTAEITTGIHRRVLLVDRSAILHDDESNRTSLVLMTPDSLAHTVEVQPGVRNDSLVEVIAPGLHPGLLVIREGNYALTDSTRVTVALP